MQNEYVNEKMLMHSEMCYEPNMCLPPEMVRFARPCAPSPLTRWLRPWANSLQSILLGEEFALLFSKAPDVNNNVEMENRPGPMKAVPSPAEVPTVLILLMRLG